MLDTYMSIRKDITKLIEQTTVIQKQYTDQLTRLANRLKLISDLESMESVHMTVKSVTKDGVSSVT